MNTKLNQIQHRLAIGNEQERLAALAELLECGQQGFDCFMEHSLKDKSEKVQQSAYWFLHDYNPYSSNQLLFILVKSIADILASGLFILGAVIGRAIFGILDDSSSTQLPIQNLESIKTDKYELPICLDLALSK